MFLKTQTFRSEKWRRAVASLPCACCLKEGESQAAHRNEGKGMGLKTSDAFTIPLCPACHREFDQGSRWTRERKREMFDAWLISTIDKLAREGLVKPHD